MKKILFLLSLAILTFASCEGPAGRDGIDGDDIDFRTTNVTIRSNDWKYVGTGKSTTLYECIKDMNVGSYTYDYGLVLVYMYQWNDASSSEVQAPLPYSIELTNGNETWSENYNYDFDSGTVAFYVECKTGTTPPECNFRVVVAP